MKKRSYMLLERTVLGRLCGKLHGASWNLLYLKKVYMFLWILPKDFVNCWWWFITHNCIFFWKIYILMIQFIYSLICMLFMVYHYFIRQSYFYNAWQFSHSPISNTPSCIMALSIKLKIWELRRYYTFQIKIVCRAVYHSFSLKI